MRCCILQPHVAVTICTLNCGETEIFILSTNHERVCVPKRAFYFMHTYQCKARLSLKWEDHNAGICKSHIWAAPQGCRWQTVAQSESELNGYRSQKKRSQMNTEACLLYTSWLWDLGNQIWSSVRYLAVCDLNLRNCIEPQIWLFHTMTWWKLKNISITNQMHSSSTKHVCLSTFSKHTIATWIATQTC